MPQAHRNGDSRVCGAATIVTGQSSVFVNGRLWSVDGDPNSHGDGPLSASVSSVRIAGKPVIVNAPDSAGPDALCFIVGPPHCSPDTADGSGNVNAG